VRVLLWHVHGSWTTAFVQGQHEYLLPVTPDRGPDGLGRARTWDWPASAREVTPDQLREISVDGGVDVVVLQRTRDLDLVREWLGREPGRDLPAVFLEHNAPGLEPGDGPVPHTRHPLADRGDIPIAHVTHFNQLFYDNGRAPTTVIEHGIVDPGERWTGELVPGCSPPGPPCCGTPSAPTCTTRTPPGWPARRPAPPRWSGTGFPGSSPTGTNSSVR